MMRLMDRRGDMTVHICADCGGRIYGECAVVEDLAGGRTYKHPYRCDIEARETIRREREMLIRKGSVSI